MRITRTRSTLLLAAAWLATGCEDEQQRPEDTARAQMALTASDCPFDRRIHHMLWTVEYDDGGTRKELDATITRQQMDTACANLGPLADLSLPPGLGYESTVFAFDANNLIINDLAVAHTFFDVTGKQTTTLNVRIVAVTGGASLGGGITVDNASFQQPGRVSTGCCVGAGGACAGGSFGQCMVAIQTGTCTAWQDPCATDGGAPPDAVVTPVDATATDAVAVADVGSPPDAVVTPADAVSPPPPPPPPPPPVTAVDISPVSTKVPAGWTTTFKAQLVQYIPGSPLAPTPLPNQPSFTFSLGQPESGVLVPDTSRSAVFVASTTLPSTAPSTCRPYPGGGGSRCGLFSIKATVSSGPDTGLSQIQNFEVELDNAPRLGPSLFSCRQLSPGGNFANGQGVITALPGTCWGSAADDIGWQIVPAGSPTHIGAANIGGTTLWRCDQACAVLPCLAPLGTLTTNKGACWNGSAVNTGWAVQPGAPLPPPPGSPSVVLPTGSKHVYRCDDVCNNLSFCYRQGLVTTDPQFCAGGSARATDTGMVVQ